MAIQDLLITIKEEVYYSIPENYRPAVTLLIYASLIAIYAIIIWKFYRFLAKRDILELNLSRYNKTSHPGWYKLFALIFYLIEYIIIIPILVFFWFGVLAIFLILLSKNQDVSSVLMISGAIIAAIRITSYYSGDLSKDLAKMFPFTVLAIFLLEPDFFSLSRLVSRFSEISGMFQHILIYLAIIAVIELVLRLVFLIGKIGSSEEEV